MYMRHKIKLIIILRDIQFKVMVLSQEGTLSTVWNEISSYDLVNFMRDFRVADKGDGT